jgi:hypothetical protein
VLGAEPAELLRDAGDIFDGGVSTEHAEHEGGVRRGGYEYSEYSTSAV